VHAGDHLSRCFCWLFAKSLFLLTFSPRVLSVNFLFCSFVFRRGFSNVFKRLGGEGRVLSVLSLSHCFYWIFLDDSKVRFRPACSPFTLFSPSSLSQLCPLAQVMLL